MADQAKAGTIPFVPASSILAAVWPFWLDLIGRAAEAAIASGGTTALGIVGTIIISLSDILAEKKQRGWAGVRQHWRDRLKYAVGLSVAWWGLLICYHLIVTVPRGIWSRSETERPSANIPAPPRPPDDAYKSPPVRNGQHGESAADIAAEVAKLLPNSHPLPPSFSVDIELAIVNSKGRGFDTSLWSSSMLSGIGCILSPSDAALFIRITNTGSYPELITHYNVTLGNQPPQEGIPMLTSELVRLGFGKPIYMPRKGEAVNETDKVLRFQQGPGAFAMRALPSSDADPAHAVPVDLVPSLDDEIGGKYIEPDKSARGWVLFENRSDDPFFFAEMNITITDQGDHRFFYKLPLKNGNPFGDILPREVIMHPAVDMSNCTIKSYYTNPMTGR
ncbi:MAG TPA: hypothetical protein VG206_16235 [Terriglobia bacterium]|nr:hypothetical protein [Terriglobia bacterium]